MKIRFAFLSAAFLCSSIFIAGQGSSVEMVTVFGNRMNSPIEMDVSEESGKYSFDVYNRSNYPYYFKIKFTSLLNLSPNIIEREAKLQPGLNRLFTLKIVNPEQPADFSYSITSMIAASDVNAELNFPYLIPVGKNKTVTLFSEPFENGKRRYLNQFIMMWGDTVFAVRKGYVAALPDNKEEVERIMESGSLEVRQGDGTISVYQGIAPATCNLEIGQYIYPGQPVGTAGRSEKLILNVFEVLDGGRLKNLEIYYSGIKGELISSMMVDGKKLPYYEPVITREMTKKELSKHEKGVLIPSGKEKGTRR
jgi:hypothetical protein